jgi:hypothetical protein
MIYISLTFRKPNSDTPFKMYMLQVKFMHNVPRFFRNFGVMKRFLFVVFWLFAQLSVHATGEPESGEQIRVSFFSDGRFLSEVLASDLGSRKVPADFTGKSKVATKCCDEGIGNEISVLVRLTDDLADSEVVAFISLVIQPMHNESALLNRDVKPVRHFFVNEIHCDERYESIVLSGDGNSIIHFIVPPYPGMSKDQLRTEDSGTSDTVNPNAISQDVRISQDVIFNCPSCYIQYSCSCMCPSSTPHEQVMFKSLRSGDTPCVLYSFVSAEVGEGRNKVTLKPYDIYIVDRKKITEASFDDIIKLSSTRIRK